jgi:hypothetical protein
VKFIDPQTGRSSAACIRCGCISGRAGCRAGVALNGRICGYRKRRRRVVRDRESSRSLAYISAGIGGKENAGACSRCSAAVGQSTEGEGPGNCTAIVSSRCAAACINKSQELCRISGAVALNDCVLCLHGDHRRRIVNHLDGLVAGAEIAGSICCSPGAGDGAVARA